MSKAKSNPPPSKGKGATSAPIAATASTPPPAKVAPLYRGIDWLTFGVTTLLVFIGYYLTLAPDLTLEDCGELAVGSFYAGVPHPPGYPVWTIYTWLFTVLLPFHNIAWRVAVSSAFAGALSCGLIGLMVSRGSSMILESIQELKDIDRRWENAICIISGYVAGMLMGFNGFMWSQAVIVEVYTLSVLSLVGVLVCLLHWIYDTSKERYLYWALFLFGICFTNHQTLIVAAVGIEVLILVRSPKLGRDLFLANSVIYLLVVVYMAAKASGGGNPINPMILKIFHVIGIGSLFTCVWLTLKTNKMLTEWKPVLIMGLLWVAGCLFYLYMPLASMSNPPMNWGYPRTVEGFKHALTRGQYESAKPTSDPLLFFKQVILYSEGAIEEFNFVYLAIGLVPFLFLRRMQNRERAWILGLSAIYLCLAVLLLILLNPQPDRQSLSLNRVFFTSSHVMIAMGIGYGLTLIAGMTLVNYERFRPYAIMGSAAATGVALYALVSLDKLLPIAQTTAIFALLLALATLAVYVIFRGKNGPILPLLGLFVLFPAHSILSHWWDNEQRGHMFGFWFGHDMFTPPFKAKDGKPLYPKMAKDAVLFGGTDPGRFNPTYMIFCESFIPSSKKVDPEFDRRDVYIITQNALADGTYLSYIRAHYNRSTQIDPPFFQELARRPQERQQNTFTNLLARAISPLDRAFTSLGDSLEKSRRVGTSFFKPTDFIDVPGLASRLAKGGEPTALSKFLAENLSERARQLLSASGSEPALAKALARDFNQVLEKGVFDCQLLKQRTDEKRTQTASLEAVRKQKAGAAGEELQKLALTEKDLLQKLSQLERDIQTVLTNINGLKLSGYVQRFLQENPQGHTRIRLNRLLLEEAYPKHIAKSVGGVYPDMEIHTPTPDDSQKAFEDYVTDAQRRIKLNQLKPGEDVRIDGNRLQVSGQVAVMAINGLLTKVIFDKNPDHEFYVEESFPLDWMYPYLTPFGIIMKINRQPLPELSDAVLATDHEFWSQFSGRLIGNWITYDTPVKEIAAFAERVYLRGDFTGFKGDPKFVRDDNGQKAFSKLRSAIAGLYTWRINNSKSVAEQQRMIKEADFAYRQAFAFCPYSPEAVFRYVNLLTSMQRFDDALLIAQVCEKLDPANAGVQSLVDQLRGLAGKRGTPPPQGQPHLPPQTQAAPQPPNQVLQALPQLEQQYRTNPTDLGIVIKLASAYWQIQRSNDALAVLDKLANHPQTDAGGLTTLAQAYAQLGQVGRLEFSLLRLVGVNPQSPEAWYDLASVQAAIGKNPDALKALSNAFRLSDERLKKKSDERNLRTNALADPRFSRLRQMPDYEKLAPPK